MNKPVLKNTAETKIFQNFDFSNGESVIDQLYRFCMGLKWHDVSENVQHHLKNLFLDLTGVLAIAEYHGPRSQVMKVASNPTMLKDGSGWGAMTGVSAAYMARSGFTGAPRQIQAYGKQRPL
jgi:2-methylcitrate dehydratase PrpD